MESIDPFKQEANEADEQLQEELHDETQLEHSETQQQPKPNTHAEQETPPPIRREPVRLKDLPDRPLIEIVDALKTTEGATSSYIAYVIRSQAGEARRRYSEFEMLRAVLGKLYPVLIIPPIPPHHSMADYAVKQSKAKEDASVIARRRRMLQVFLNRCNRHPILNEDRVFQRFLDPNTSFAELLHAPPVTNLPKNVLRAPARDPTDTSMADMYNALPLPSSTSSLQEPDQRFLDSEAFTAKFSGHLSGSLEKVNRRLMKRWTDLGADEADLGGILNGFGLLEQNANADLATAIEKVGQAIDSTYVHTNVMLQEWERLYTEPLAEYSQFSAVIKGLLKFRHNKHVQFEMTRDVLEAKRASLEELERSEAEARRLDSALDRALSRVKALETDGTESAADPSTSQTSPPTSSADATSPSSTSQQLPESSSMRQSKSSSSSIGFLNALTHTFHSVVDTDPEATRRNGIGKTRESIAHLENGVKATAEDLKFATQTIQADLDRFQRQKVVDFKQMMLAFSGFHKEWAQSNLKQWEEVLESVKAIEV